MSAQANTTPFSIFVGAKNTVPADHLTLADTIIMSRSDALRPQVEAIRVAKAAGDDNTVARLKQDLPAVTISGIFSGRNANGLQAHSGLLVMDFDSLGQETITALAPRLASDPYVQASFKSPGGTGLKVVVRIPADPSTQRASFATAAAYFKQQHGIVADESGKDVSRLCFLSWDPDAFLRAEDAVEIVPVVEAPKPARAVTSAPASVDEIRSALEALNPGCKYDQWIRIGMSIHSALPGADGLVLWDTWSSRSSKYTADVCASRWNGFTPGTITIATLFGAARDAGWRKTYNVAPAAVAAAPVHKPAVTLPSGASTITACATVLGRLLGDRQMLFTRGGTLTRVSRGDDGLPRLETVPPVALASIFEQVALLDRMTKDGPEPAICVEQTARLISAADSFREALPRITVLSPCPVILEREGCLLEVSGHNAESGIYAGGMPAETVRIEEARRLLGDVVEGFRFATPGDQARALASLITPALTFGGLLNGRPPIDLGEANNSQAGKGFRNKLIAAIYGQGVKAVTQKNGGVGSLEETFNAALIGGANFISLDNIRGRVDSPAIESFMTEDHYSARMPYREPVDIDPRRVVVMFTSNKADVTTDLANRSSCVRILKHPDGHAFKTYPGGDILDHVRANQSRYLGAVFTVVRAWFDAGKPKTRETRHDFRGWAQTLDWIVQELLGAGPLLDGHRETQQRMTNPALSWLRVVAQEVIRTGKDCRWLKANAVVSMLEDTGIEIPGLKADADLTSQEAQKAVLLAVGRQLGRCFTTGDVVKIDNITIERREQYDAQYSKNTREYMFSANPLAGGVPTGVLEKAPEPLQLVREPTPEEQMNVIQKFLDRARLPVSQCAGVN